jgi:AraC-like DNA-binding protein
VSANYDTFTVRSLPPNINAGASLFRAGNITQREVMTVAADSGVSSVPTSYYVSEAPQTSIDERAFRHPLLSSLKRHFLEHISEPLTTARAAELLGFRCRTYFCEFFRSQTGRTFVAWRKECRLELAKRLLSEYPWLTITDVAAASGLDASSFARTFRKHVGVTPRNYRKHANEPPLLVNSQNLHEGEGDEAPQRVLARSNLGALVNRRRAPSRATIEQHPTTFRKRPTKHRASEFGRN